MIPPVLLSAIDCHRHESTSEKGKKAICIVQYMLWEGLIPLKLQTAEIDCKDLQLVGEDIIINQRITLQVKCDYRCGAQDRGGTGNLYLQTEERNVFGYY
jgi:hypothetical protein